MKYDSRYPIAILLVIFVLGALSGLFLPETLHQKLPDSLEEARMFGRDQVGITVPPSFSVGLHYRKKNRPTSSLTNALFLLKKNLSQKFWGLPKPHRRPSHESQADDEELQRLKQAQFAP